MFIATSMFRISYLVANHWHQEYNIDYRIELPYSFLLVQYKYKACWNLFPPEFGIIQGRFRNREYIWHIVGKYRPNWILFINACWPLANLFFFYLIQFHKHSIACALVCIHVIGENSFTKLWLSQSKQGMNHSWERENFEKFGPQSVSTYETEPCFWRWF